MNRRALRSSSRRRLASGVDAARRSERTKLASIGHCAVVLASLAVGAGFLTPAASPALGSPTVFTDPVGDVSGAPDISEIAVSHDLAGTITFVVSVANEPTLLPGHRLELRFDSDRNPETGASNGVDKLIELGILSGGRLLLCSWAGTSFPCVTAGSPSAASLVGSYSNGQWTVSISKTDLGTVDGFKFSVAGFVVPGPIDYAPSSAGNYEYLLSDAVAPVITVPADLTVEATSPAGAIVAYSVTASDDVDPHPAVACTPASGSPFGLGMTTVSCAATDASGNTASASFDVTVVDTTPPVLTVPDAITVDATSPSGATVTFTATAVDVVDMTFSALCEPASGTTFPIGDTTVSCAATDAAGNSAAGASFVVHVRGAAEQTSALIELVLATSATQGIINSLDAKLVAVQQALAAANADNRADATNKLDAFMNEVAAQSGKALAAEEASALISAATRISAALG